MGTARADTVVLEDSLLFGKVRQVRSDDILFAPGCRGSRVIRRDRVRRIDYHAGCTPRPVTPYSSGGAICSQTASLHELRFANPAALVHASDYQLGEGRVHFVSADGSQVAHGPAAGLTSATRRLVCLDAVQALRPLPGFCTETRQWAINFSYDPAFGNMILTRGVSFYLEDEEGNPRAADDPLGATIRQAFGSAVTIWMGALQDRRSALPDRARQVIDSMISRSSNYSLLTPPQVIRVGCADSATFVVRYASRSERDLVNPDGSDPKAARAQVEGRTLLINGVRYPCWKADLQRRLSLGPDPVSGLECRNLVPVLVHELGHAFGLAGHVDGDQPSIMDSVIREDLLWPTPRDADDLAAVLTSPIAGAPAGRLDADGRGISIEGRQKQ